MNTELLSKLDQRNAASGMKAADFENLGFCKFGATACFALCVANLIATFGNHIACVVAIGSKPEMGRIATSGIVAMVKCAKAIGPFTCCEKTSEDMGKKILWLRPIKTVADLAVPFSFVEILDPRPAFIG